jgi:nicotinate-nucleotide adenylyltransferase
MGGCFNPFHVGHLRLALEVYERLALDRLELIPVYKPPHKSGDDLAPFDVRVDWIAASIVGLNGFVINKMEAERDEPSYTIDTLSIISRSHPMDDLYFILGVGDFLQFPNWHRGFELIEHVNLAVAARSGEGVAEVDAFIAEHWQGVQRESESVRRLPSGYCVEFVDVPRLDVSATQIRQALLEGKNIKGLVASGVLKDIRARENHLKSLWSEEEKGSA